MKQIIKKLLNKPELLKRYDFFLIHDEEVKDKESQWHNQMADDVIVHLYVIPLKDGDKYLKCVIEVQIGDFRWYSKYDTTRWKANEGTEKEMLDICVKGINRSWGLNHFRWQARAEIRKLSLAEKLLYL